MALLLAAAGARAEERKAPPWEKPGRVARYLFLENCSVCHDTEKAKSKKIGPSLARFKKVPAERSAAFRQYIMLKVQAGGIAMPSFKDALTEEQIRTIASYVLPE
jgi:mono/diheme cytochrome c family protein